MDDANGRTPVFHQGDVDRELAVFLHEFLGAIQRIHEPVGRPLAALRKGGLGTFFGEHGKPGLERGEAFDQTVVSGAVGLGEGGVVVLGLYVEVAAVDVENAVAGLLDQGQQAFGEFASGRIVQAHYGVSSVSVRSRSSARKMAAILRASVKSGRASSVVSSASGQGTTSMGSGSSPGNGAS